MGRLIILLAAIFTILIIGVWFRLAYSQEPESCVNRSGEYGEGTAAYSAMARDMEQPHIIPIGRTTGQIKPFYVHKVKVKAIKTKAKKASYCPPESADYQCPMPKGMDNAKPQ